LGPHTGHHLADCTYGVHRCASSDGFTIDGSAPVAVTLAKDFEEGFWVLDRFQKGVDVLLTAEIDPDFPGPDLGGDKLPGKLLLIHLVEEGNKL
jgi:hypothetical protein